MTAEVPESGCDLRSTLFGNLWFLELLLGPIPSLSPSSKCFNKAKVYNELTHRDFKTGLTKSNQAVLTEPVGYSLGVIWLWGDCSSTLNPIFVELLFQKHATEPPHPPKRRPALGHVRLWRFDRSRAPRFFFQAQVRIAFAIVARSDSAWIGETQWHIPW